MNEVKLDLTEEQQVIEMGRLARDVMENEAFQVIMEGVSKDMQIEFNALEPNDTHDFTVLAAQKKLFNKILMKFESFKRAGAGPGKTKEGGLA